MRTYTHIYQIAHGGNHQNKSAESLKLMRAFCSLLSQVHRALMLAALVVAAAGFILVFIAHMDNPTPGLIELSEVSPASCPRPPSPQRALAVTKFVTGNACGGRDQGTAHSTTCVGSFVLAILSFLHLVFQPDSLAHFVIGIIVMAFHIANVSQT